MRVLMAAPVPKRREGGVAAIAYNLGEGIAKRGHDVKYVFFDDLPAGPSVPARFIEADFGVKLAAFIRRHRGEFDVVNLHAPCGWYHGLLQLFMPWRKSPPCVLTLHGLEERRMHVMSREVKKGRAWHYNWKNRLRQRLYTNPRFRLCIRSADYAHCYARDVATILQLKYHLDSERVAYIPNGVGEQYFVSREYREQPCLRLLYAGTWLDQRGIFYIRDALQDLRDSSVCWSLTIAGSGAPSAELQEFFGEAIRDRIHATNVIPAEKMPDLYRQHDVLLFPSLMEGLPSVVLEAMAAGMAVITTDTCGMPDVVEDDVTGLLLPPADAEAIGAAIVRLGQSVDLRRRLGEAAREKMRHYTWERSAAKFEQVLASAVGGGGRGTTTE